jgi:hypothetical protein
MSSPKIARVFLAPEPQTDLSLPVAALIFGAVWQVETLIELADRVCEPVFHRSKKATTDAAVANG